MAFPTRRADLGSWRRIWQ
jgi:ABC-2 type transport system ATP-binding protein